MSLINPSYRALVALAAVFVIVAPAGAEKARIESSERDKVVTARESSNSDLTIESVGDGTASKAAGDPLADRKVTLDVGVGVESEDGSGPAMEQREFGIGKRATVFQDTYSVSYIDDMTLNDQGESEPVLADEEFGRWLDIAVNEISDDAVRVTVYFVRKRPVNVATDGSGPRIELPEADFSMVSRDVQLSRGESEDLRIRGNDGSVRLRLGVPRR